MQYLNEEKEVLNVQKKGGIDFIPFGQKTVFKEELLSSHNFQKMLNDLKASYNWIFVANVASPLSLETQVLRVCRFYYLFNLERKAL